VPGCQGPSRVRAHAQEAPESWHPVTLPRSTPDDQWQSAWQPDPTWQPDTRPDLGGFQTLGETLGQTLRALQRGFFGDPAFPQVAWAHPHRQPPQGNLPAIQKPARAAKGTIGPGMSKKRRLGSYRQARQTADHFVVDYSRRIRGLARAAGPTGPVLQRQRRAALGEMPMAGGRNSVEAVALSYSAALSAGPEKATSTGPPASSSAAPPSEATPVGLGACLR
jgi:hypothetical protein